MRTGKAWGGEWGPGPPTLFGGWVPSRSFFSPFKAVKSEWATFFHPFPKPRLPPPGAPPPPAGTALCAVGTSPDGLFLQLDILSTRRWGSIGSGGKKGEVVESASNTSPRLWYFGEGGSSSEIIWEPPPPEGSSSWFSANPLFFSGPRDSPIATYCERGFTLINLSDLQGGLPSHSLANTGPRFSETRWSSPVGSFTKPSSAPNPPKIYTPPPPESL